TRTWKASGIGTGRAEMPLGHPHKLILLPGHRLCPVLFRHVLQVRRVFRALILMWDGSEALAVGTRSSIGEATDKRKRRDEEGTAETEVKPKLPEKVIVGPRRRKHRHPALSVSRAPGALLRCRDNA